MIRANIHVFFFFLLMGSINLASACSAQVREFGRPLIIWPNTAFHNDYRYDA